MLNYGSAAQVYFNYNTDQLINAQLTSEDQARISAYSQDMVHSIPNAVAAKQGVFSKTDGFIQRYPSVSFEGAFLINYYFMPGSTPTDGMQLYYWSAAAFDAAQLLTPENSTGVLEMTAANGIYSAAIDNIPAKDLNEPIYVSGVYTDAQGNSHATGILGFSIGAYCASKANLNPQGPLAQATAVYGHYASLYFGD